MFTHQLLLGHEIQENEMRGAHDTYVGQEKCIEGFGSEAWRNEIAWKLWEYKGLHYSIS